MISSEFIVTLKGNKQFVLFAGLLDAATQSGLRSLQVRLLQVPGPDNQGLAIAEAVATFEDGRQFTEIGDAGPENLAPAMRSAACRMAATRAKARVLRDALNVGVCSFEELPPQSDEAAFRPAEAPTLNEHTAGCERCGMVLTKAQETLSNNKWGRLLCPIHQREAA